VAKNALEAVNRYVARELGPDGIRSNLIAAGPLKTLAAKAIAGDAVGPGGELDQMQHEWARRAPLGWDVEDPTPVATTAVALLSDLMKATTGTVIYADGGAGTVSSADRRADVTEAAPVDALLLLSFGGPDGQEDVIPFLENV